MRENNAEANDETWAQHQSGQIPTQKQVNVVEEGKHESDDRKNEDKEGQSKTVIEFVEEKAPEKEVK